MKNNTIIKFENVWKKFRRGRKLLLKEALLDIFKPASTEEFWALENINFQIKKGESLGIIGPNGSGKSTILKLIARVMVPTTGNIATNGRIAPLIELGAGFHPELTGRENIYINGAILGLSKKEIDKRFDNIVDFAELVEFIDTPIKHYSSGMHMRLGFAIAVNVDPDILLVDEVLAVGDTNFQRKCIKKMEEFKKNKVTIVFVSHNLEMIKSFCDQVVFLRNSKVVFQGKPDKAIAKYQVEQI